MSRGIEDIGVLVAANIRAERSRLRCPQRQLAVRLSMSQTTVSQMEAGRRGIGVDDLLALCAALRVPLIRLLVGADVQLLQTLGMAGRGEAASPVGR